MARCATLESRLDTMVASISSMAANQAKTEATLATLVEAQQAAISAVTSLTEKLDILTSRYEEPADRAAHSRASSRFVAPSTSGSRP